MSSPSSPYKYICRGCGKVYITKMLGEWSAAHGCAYCQTGIVVKVNSPSLPVPFVPVPAPALDRATEGSEVRS